MSDVGAFDDPGRTVRLREGSVAWRRVVDDVVVLDTVSSRYHAVNASGTAVWERLAAGATVGELVEALTASFPSAAPRAAADIASFLAELDDRGLLEKSRDEAGIDEPGAAPAGPP